MQNETLVQAIWNDVAALCTYMFLWYNVTTTITTKSSGKELPFQRKDNKDL